MFDFPILPSTATLGSWIYQGCLFAAIFFAFGLSCRYSYGGKKGIGTKIFFPILVMVYIITSFTDGDFSHYQMMVKSYSGPESTGLERIYEYVIELTNQNYFLFRTIFFGGMILLLLRLFKNYNLDKYNALYFLFAVFIGTLSYSRASVGMTFLFLGLSIFFSDNRSIIKTLIGALFILASYFFHRSCIVLIPMTLLGFVPINKKTIPIILCAVVLSFAVLKGLASDIINEVASSDNEELALKAELYMSGSSGQFSGNIIAWFMHIWNYGVFYVLFFVDTYYLIYNKNQVSRSIKGLFNVTFGVLLFAILMNFFNMTSVALYYRYLFMLMIPTTVMTTYLYQKGMLPLKRFKFLFWFGCIPTIENILYHIYYLLSH